jgi:MinD-like ATPase involved in chromosome partitioning or flagellar assembly
VKNTLKIAVHSFKGGTGKSTITANVAVMLAQMGKNVGVMDLDLAGPGLHVLLGIHNDDIKNTLNDLFLGNCVPMETVMDLSNKFLAQPGTRSDYDSHDGSYGLVSSATIQDRTKPLGKLVFIPASFKAQDMIRVLTKGYEVRLFREAIRQISDGHSLDYLFIDTHPGIEESTLLAMGVCDLLLLVSRIDSQDLFGTGVILEVAKALNRPKILVTNMIPPGSDEEKLKERLRKVFDINPSTTIPFYTEILKTLSSEVFVYSRPEHEFRERLYSLTTRMIDICDRVNADGFKCLTALNEKT